jgi:uncharacterized protein YoxC
MEQAIVNTLLTKESVFAILFVFMLFKQIKHTESQQAENKFREEKMYSFLDGMKNEFAKLVTQYERLSNDVEGIKEELKQHQDKGEK